MRLKLIKLFFCLCLVLIVFGVRHALAFSPGETIIFSVDPTYDLAGRTQIKATLRQVGDKALFYVEDDWWYSLKNPDDVNAIITNLKEEFDKNIYSRMTSVFGSEWSPGIDNEYRVTILISRLKEGTGGYFNSADEYPKSLVSSSNEREMIYLNGIYLFSNLSRTEGFLVHEFQHLITFYQKDKSKNVSEETWLNEARSEYASTLCGYDDVYQGSNLERRVNEFLRNSSDSLTEWTNETVDYGPADLFMQYLVSRYGEIILTKIMRSSAVGIESINEALASLGSRDNFSDVFANWEIANFVNDCQLGDSKNYCYLTNRLPYERLHVSPVTSKILSTDEGAMFAFSDNIKDWSGHWYEILPSGEGLNLAINFSGNLSGSWRVPVILYNFDGTKSVRNLALSNQAGSDLVSDFGSKVKDAILIPINQSKLAGFTANETLYPFAYSVKMTSSDRLFLPPGVSSISTSTAQMGNVLSAVTPNYPDGSLIRAKGDYRVFVIKGKYKRWIQSPAVLAAYPHLGWQSIIEVKPEELAWYQDAWLIRSDGDYRVYEINGDFTKHWLNMSAQQFAASGRKWDMVFVINKTERDLYRTGAAVLK